MQTNCYALRFADAILKRDRQFVSKAIELLGDNVVKLWTDPELRGNREVVLAAVKQNGMALQFADKKIIDYDFVSESASFHQYTLESRKELTLISLFAIEKKMLQNKFGNRFNINCSSLSIFSSTAITGLSRIKGKPVAALVIDNNFTIISGPVDFGSDRIDSMYLDPTSPYIAHIRSVRSRANFGALKIKRRSEADDISKYVEIFEITKSFRGKIAQAIPNLDKSKIDEILRILLHCKELPTAEDLFNEEVYRRIFCLESLTKEEYEEIKTKLDSLQEDANDARKNINEFRGKHKLPLLQVSRLNGNIFVEPYNEIHIPASPLMIKNITALITEKNFYQVYLMHKDIETLRELFAKVCEANADLSKSLNENEKKAIKMFYPQKVTTYQDFFDQVAQKEIEFFEACKENYENIAISLCQTEPKEAMRAALQAQRFAEFTTKEGIFTACSKKFPKIGVYSPVQKTVVELDSCIGIDPEILGNAFKKSLTLDDLRSICNLIKCKPKKAAIFLRQEHNGKKCEDCIRHFLLPGSTVKKCIWKLSFLLCSAYSRPSSQIEDEDYQRLLELIEQYLEKTQTPSGSVSPVSTIQLGASDDRNAIIRK